MRRPWNTCPYPLRSCYHSWVHTSIFPIQPLVSSYSFFFALFDEFCFCNYSCLLSSIRSMMSKIPCSKPVTLIPNALHAFDIAVLIHLDVFITVWLWIIWELAAPTPWQGSKRENSRVKKICYQRNLPLTIPIRVQIYEEIWGCYRRFCFIVNLRQRVTSHFRWWWFCMRCLWKICIYLNWQRVKLVLRDNSIWLI